MAHKQKNKGKIKQKPSSSAETVHTILQTVASFTCNCYLTVNTPGN